MFDSDVTTGRAAVAAAAELIRSMGAPLAVRHKIGADIVTDIDLAAEQVIRDTILSAFPQDALLAEEAGESEGASGRAWFIDPLDGTANFSRGIPHFAIAIALQVDATIRLAITADVSRDETFTAAGDPATCNGAAITASAVDDPRDALIALQLPEPLWREETALQAPLNTTRGLRVTGSTALDLAWTAAGRFDLCIYRRTTAEWDWRGGEHLVRAAGGAVEAIGSLGDRKLMAAGSPALIDIVAAWV